jgi:hypothetical protein
MHNICGDPEMNASRIRVGIENFYELILELDLGAVSIIHEMNSKIQCMKLSIHMSVYNTYFNNTSEYLYLGVSIGGAIQSRAPSHVSSATS